MRRPSIAQLLTIPVVLAGMAWVAGEARGQTVVVEVDGRLPAGTRRVIETALADTAAERSTGERTIAADQVQLAPLVHFGGVLVIEGTLVADVTAVGSEVYLRPGASVAGRLLVVGGGYYGTTMADVSGRLVWLRDEPLEVVDAGPGAVRVQFRERAIGFPFEPKGLAGITVRHYNGVDGLSFGLVAGLKPLPRVARTEFAGGPVFRTERNDVGWDVGGLHSFPSLGDVVLAGRAYSITDSYQRWHRATLGNSLSSLFTAGDNRTHFERTGYTVWVEGPSAWPAVVRLRWRDDEFDSLVTKAPFALFGGDEDWTPNPSILEGSGRAVALELAWDRRDNPSITRRGVYAAGWVEHWGFGGDWSFDWAQVDVRAFVPVGRESFASGRLLTGGRLGSSVDGPDGDLESLPPQFRYRFGGTGSLVGHDFPDHRLVGDRMAVVHLRYHHALSIESRIFDAVYLVALADLGDAWFDDETRELNKAIGGGIAGRGRSRYMGLFVAYGIDSEQWELYIRTQPWF